MKYKVRKFVVYLTLTMSVACGSGSRPSTTVKPPPSQARDWFPMLGEAVPGPIKRTPKYDIGYQANGFDEVKPKQVQRTARWLEEQGAGHLVTTFVEMANSVADMPKWVDDAYDHNLRQYQGCGGNFARFISGVNPSTVVVEVVAIPQYSPFANSWAGGLAFPDGVNARCTIVVAGGLIDNPPTAHLAMFKDYVRWEIGNLLAFRYGVKPKTVAQEWGDQVPCTR